MISSVVSIIQIFMNYKSTPSISSGEAGGDDDDDEDEEEEEEEEDEHDHDEL